MRTPSIHYKFILLIVLLGNLSNLYGQQLLETKEGDPLYTPFLINQTGKANDAMSTALIKLNLGDQSIGADYYFRLPKKKAVNDEKYWFMNAGFKAKPTEGYASVFKNNQFSPGGNLTASFNRFKVLDKNDTESGDWFIDWGGIFINVNPNRYSLYNPDTTFTSRLYSKDFIGFGGGLNYNALLWSRFIFSAKLSYTRKSNFSDLDEFEFKDVHSEYDMISGTTRTETKTKSARLDGEYEEFDNWNFRIAVTRATPDGGVENAVGFGYSLYFDFMGPQNSKNTTNVGIILFMSQTKKYISSPVLGIDFQLADIGNNYNGEAGLGKRFSVGLTSVIPIR